MNAKAFAPPWLFTVAEYHRMAEAGIFTEDARVELIEGEIVAMSPIGSRHAACVDRIAALVRDRVSGVIVRVQNPIRLSDHSEPQPDLSLLRARDDFYAAGHPGPEDVLLLIEVADASVMYDRNTKIPLYARSGIREVWLADLVTNVVEVHSAPAGSSYSQMQRFQRGATVTSAQLPELRIEAAEMLIG
ncbi:MAG TPA: Uma2 family endonuclease [Thermoanaerobaculia bacterium]|nr:Uma2 family endonuclease [Thermoanaerobaculia bacterium]